MASVVAAPYRAVVPYLPGAGGRPLSIRLPCGQYLQQSDALFGFPGAWRPMARNSAWRCWQKPPFIPQCRQIFKRLVDPFVATCDGESKRYFEII